MNPRIWSTSPQMANMQIAIMSIISISSIVCVLIVPSLNLPTKAILISTPFTSFLFLMIHVKYMDLEGHQFVLKTIFTTKTYQYDEIKSHEIKNERGINCLVIHLKKPLYFRRQFIFQGITKESPEYQALIEKINHRI